MPNKTNYAEKNECLNKYNKAQQKQTHIIIVLIIVLSSQCFHTLVR